MLRIVLQCVVVCCSEFHRFVVVADIESSACSVLQDVVVQCGVWGGFGQ